MLLVPWVGAVVSAPMVDARPYRVNEPPGVGVGEARSGAAEAPADLAAESQRSVERAIDAASVFGVRLVMLNATLAAVASALGAALLIEDKKP